jgi:thioredoxin
MTEQLTKASFIDKVFDYENVAAWKFKGTLPSIIDFWAEWCGPCKMISPVLEQIAKENEGKINVFKVNVDQETELMSFFKINSIPSLLFIPVDGEPKMSIGAIPRANILKLVKDILKV